MIKNVPSSLYRMAFNFCFSLFFHVFAVCSCLPFSIFDLCSKGFGCFIRKACCAYKTTQYGKKRNTRISIEFYWCHYFMFYMSSVFHSFEYIFYAWNVLFDSIVMKNWWHLLLLWKIIQLAEVYLAVILSSKSILSI